MSRRTNGMAVASLVLGMPCFWGFFVPPLLAVIFGHVSLGRIATSAGTLGGRGLAIAGVELAQLGHRRRQLGCVAVAGREQPRHGPEHLLALFGSRRVVALESSP